MTERRYDEEEVAAILRSATPTTRRFLGMPIGVGRTVDVHRKVFDGEREQIVVDLRETFDARGRLKQEGSFRQWTNGNLQALLEPVPTGDRLRLKTVNANARGWMMGGIAAMTVAAATAIGGFALARVAAGPTNLTTDNQ